MMISPNEALHSIPEGLRRPLLDEFSDIVNNFMEGRWLPAELSGGRFCEIVYTILNGYPSGSYPSFPTKPSNFVDACRRLENNSNSPRSFQILIPRLLPALYEVRNNRNVGHVGGDVDPDLMDSSVVVSITSWILAELIRVFHEVTTDEAQKLVESIVERRVQVVWKSGDFRRVLKPDLSLNDQVLLLLATCNSKVQVDQLFAWTDYDNRSYFNRVLRKLHDRRFVEFNQTFGDVELLPPGYDSVEKIMKTIR